MSLRNAAGGVLSRFAHLAGRPAPAPKASEEEDKEQRDETASDESDDEKDKSASDEDEDKKDSRAGKKGKAEEEKDGDDDADDDEEEDKPSARSSASAVAKARRDERARCAAIFAAPEAAGAVALAAHLAFETDLPAAAAIGALTAAGTGAPATRGGLGARMAAEGAPRLGADGRKGPDRETPQGNAQHILAAAGLLPRDRK